jgi:hypothetical protein
MHAYPAVMVDTGTIRERIAQLQAEHHGLDSLIGKMAGVPGINHLEIRRLKKRKLKVKDTIILLQLQLEPDAR